MKPLSDTLATAVRRHGVRACRTSRRFPAAVAVILLSFGIAPNAARADLLDDVLSILSTAGMVDPAVVEAKPMLQCLIDGKAVVSCADEAAGKAHGLVPNDPKIKKVVDIFHAVHAKAWLDVFMLSGEQVVCSFVPGGAIKELFCGEIFDVAEPVITAAYNAVLEGDILALITTIGVEYACDLLPSAPGANELCGVLGEIVQGIADGVGAVIGALGSLAEDIAGQSQHMPVEEYYVKYWRSWLHYAVVKKLQSGKVSGQYGNYAMSSTSCEDYFDSHKMSASNASKVCGIMKQRFLQEVDEVTTVWQAYPASFIQGWAAPNLAGWAVAYHAKLDEYAAVTTSKHLPEYYYGPHQQIHGKYLLESDAPFKNLISECSAHKPLSMPPMPYEVHGVDKGNMGTASGWACLEAGKLLANALLAERTKINAVVPEVTALGCSKIPFPPGIHFNCSTYATFHTCRTLYPAGEPLKESLCWVNGSHADPVLAGDVLASLGEKRCRTLKKAVNMNTDFDVQCDRPWKRAMCESLVDAGSAGAHQPSAVACLLKHDRGFTAAKKEAAAIVKNLSVASTGMGSVDPATGVSSGLAIPTHANCTRSADDEWDPLRIHCEVEAANKALAASLPTCLPDPGKDGADGPCYDGPLTLAAPVNQNAMVTPDVASSDDGLSRIIDVEIDFFDRSDTGWTAVDRPSVGSRVAVRCLYEHPAVPPMEPALDWSIGFLEGGRVIGEQPGAAPVGDGGRATRTWYGRLTAAGPIELGCARLVDGEPDTEIRAVRSVDILGKTRAPSERRDEPRVGAALPGEAASLRGSAPPIDLRFAHFAGVKRAVPPAQVRDAPVIATAAVGDSVLIDCSYVFRMDAARGEAVRVAEWQSVIEVNGRVAGRSSGTTQQLGTGSARSLAHRFKPTEPGELEVRCRLDTGNAVAETDETNNELSLKLIVTGTRRVPQPAYATSSSR